MRARVLLNGELLIAGALPRRLAGASLQTTIARVAAPFA
jgi:hypothetical protein